LIHRHPSDVTLYTGFTRCPFGLPCGSELSERVARKFNLEIDMRAQSWTDIMTLLAVMVVSNKMDEKAELVMFEHAALYLRDMAAPNVTLTSTFAKDWMIENRSDIESQTSSIHYDATVKRLVKNLGILSNKDEILSEIMKWTLTDTPRSDKSEATPHKLKYKRAYHDASMRHVPMGNVSGRQASGLDLTMAS
jgi:hypothetical protein